MCCLCLTQYVHTDFGAAQGDSYTLTLPTNIKPGGYLIRHEVRVVPFLICPTMLTRVLQLLSLQLAMSPGGAEFYPMCAQVVISGSGSGTPSSGETCTFPGGYSDTDPGIYVPDVSAGFSDRRSISRRLADPHPPQVYNGNLDYIFPGPNISHLAYPGDGMITAKVPGGDAPPSGSAIGSSTVSVAVVAIPTGAGGGESSGTASGSQGGAGSVPGSGTTAGASGGVPTAGASSTAASSQPKCALKPPSGVAQSPLSTLSRRRLHHAIRRFFTRSS